MFYSSQKSGEKLKESKVGQPNCSNVLYRSNGGLTVTRSKIERKAYPPSALRDMSPHLKFDPYMALGFHPEQEINHF